MNKKIIYKILFYIVQFLLFGSVILIKKPVDPKGVYLVMIVGIAISTYIYNFFAGETMVGRRGRLKATEENEVRRLFIFLLSVMTYCIAILGFILLLWPQIGVNFIKSLS